MINAGAPLPWKTDDIKKLIDMSKTHTSVEIAQALNRSQAAIFRKAHKMGVRLLSKKTANHQGVKAEMDALKILPGTFLVNEFDRRLPYDAKWKGKKINIKSSKLVYYKGENRTRWNFKINNTWSNCDYFLLIGYDLNGYKPLKAWLVPSSLCRVTTVKISENYKGKYAKYEIGVD